MALFTLFTSCSGSEDDTVVVVTERGVVVADFQSIADYLADPTVQLIFTSMPRHTGGIPPDASGQYTANGTLTANSIPGNVLGDPFGPLFFCLGSASGNSLVARVFDPSIEDGGAGSFIEGSGDSFTVYTAFRSRQPTAGRENCEIHQVVIISGRREADGSLSNLFIGQGVVGLVGNCLDLIVEDVQVAETTGGRTGDTCEPAGGGTINDQVELVVQNSLVNPLVVFVDYDTIIGPQPFVVFPTEVSQPQLVPPGFFLSFESVQPVREDPDGNEVLMGDTVAGAFAQDVTPPGQSVAFFIENQVGDELYFAPEPINRTGDSIYGIVNSDLAVADPLSLLGPGSGCLCPLDPADPTPQDLGYYFYSIPGLFNPDQTNARFFNFQDDTKVAQFLGPFSLEPGTGVAVLTVDPGGIP